MDNNFLVDSIPPVCMYRQASPPFSDLGCGLLAQRNTEPPQRVKVKACFLLSTDSYGSGSDMMKVMTQLTAYYFEFYNHMRSDASNASANSQVSFGTLCCHINDTLTKPFIPQLFLSPLRSTVHSLAVS